MPRKTGKEAKTERITWFILVVLFLPLPLGSGQWLDLIPAYLFPLGVGLVLIGSGIYQYRYGWRVSPIVWMVAALMLAMAGYSWWVARGGSTPLIDPILVALIGTAGIILFGVVTNES